MEIKNTIRVILFWMLMSLLATLLWILTSHGQSAAHDSALDDVMGTSKQWVSALAIGLGWLIVTWTIGYFWRRRSPKPVGQNLNKRVLWAGYVVLAIAAFEFGYLQVFSRRVFRGQFLFVTIILTTTLLIAGILLRLLYRRTMAED